MNSPVQITLAVPEHLRGYQDVADMVGVSTFTIREWIKQRQFPAPSVAVGRRLFWNVADIESFLRHYEIVGEGVGKRIRVRSAY